jgi:hypothetical protein
MTLLFDPIHLAALVGPFVDLVCQILHRLPLP